MTKKLLLTIAMVLVMGLSASATTIGVSSLPGSLLTFNSDATFEFTPTPISMFAGWSFWVSNGTCTACLGHIDGVFTIENPNLNPAPVSGVGVLTIQDHAGENLTAEVQWFALGTSGTAGNLNVSGQINTSSAVYGGDNADLLAMLVGAVTTITFDPGVGSTPLSLAGGASFPSFSGSINAVPEPGTYTMLGAGLVALAFIRRWARN